MKKDFSLMTHEAGQLTKNIYWELNKTKGLPNKEVEQMAIDLCEVAIDLYLYSKGYTRERI